MIDRKTVESIAHLARLSFNESELLTATEQLNGILGYMEKLNELDTSSIEATAHGVEISTPMREDQVIPSEVIEAMLQQAPQSEDHFFVVPRVI